MNASLVQTMSRSLNTSLTVLFTLSALTLFGGESIRVFTFTLLIGIFSGTYSSIFNASMILVIWEKGELGLWRFNRDNRGRDGRIHRTLDCSVGNHHLTSTPVASAIARARGSPRSRERPISATRAPSAARSLAVPKPMPPVPPTRAKTLPLTPRSMRPLSLAVFSCGANA